MQVIPLPILSDNYIWLLQEGSAVLAVDPGDAAPLQAYLAQHRLTLAAVLITHRHNDHIGGLPALARADLPVYGPPGIAGVTHLVGDGDCIAIDALQLAFSVMSVPGHLPEHLAFYGHGLLLCGDVLFGCGCGRVTPGWMVQAYQSLARLAALPPSTLICCTHEYTLANQRFAREVEPDNPALQARSLRDQALRAQGLPTLPSTLADELATNPMLRWDSPAVIAAAQAHGACSAEPQEVFRAIRNWKDDYR